MVQFLRIIRFLVNPLFKTGIRQLQYFKTHQGRDALGVRSGCDVPCGGKCSVWVLLAGLASFSSWRKAGATLGSSKDWRWA